MAIQRQSQLTPSHAEEGAFSYAYRKAEKLAVALHMVTSFMDRGEPLYVQLREKGLLVLSHVLGLRTGAREQSSALERLHDTVVSVLMLLDVACHAGYLSEMNWSILRREYIDLSNFIQERKGVIGLSRSPLSRSFFHVEEPQEVERPSTSVLYPSKGQYATEPVAQKRQKRPLRRRQEERDKRRSHILNIVREKGKVTIKDISARVPEVSEKTLQRELVSLVHEEVLKREGERRWSTYSIV